MQMQNVGNLDLVSDSGKEMYKSRDIYYIKSIDLIIDWNSEITEKEVSKDDSPASDYVTGRLVEIFPDIGNTGGGEENFWFCFWW